MNLDLPVNTGVKIQVEQFEDFPLAASFPVNDVRVPGYNYHLERKRILSLSAPELCDNRASPSSWNTWQVVEVGESVQEEKVIVIGGEILCSRIQ